MNFSKLFNEPSKTIKNAKEVFNIMVGKMKSILRWQNMYWFMSTLISSILIVTTLQVHHFYQRSARNWSSAIICDVRMNSSVLLPQNHVDSSDLLCISCFWLHSSNMQHLRGPAIISSYKISYHSISTRPSLIPYQGTVTKDFPAKRNKDSSILWSFHENKV